MIPLCKKLLPNIVFCNGELNVTYWVPHLSNTRKFTWNSKQQTNSKHWNHSMFHSWWPIIMHASCFLEGLAKNCKLHYLFMFSHFLFFTQHFEYIQIILNDVKLTWYVHIVDRITENDARSRNNWYRSTWESWMGCFSASRLKAYLVDVWAFSTAQKRSVQKTAFLGLNVPSWQNAFMKFM